jgi:hypothetical protein
LGTVGPRRACSRHPRRDLAALVPVAGIWAVVIGATRVVLAFELRHLPKDIDKALTARG